jgi:hypothetical protein
LDGAAIQTVEENYTFIYLFAYSNAVGCLLGCTPFTSKFSCIGSDCSPQVYLDISEVIKQICCKKVGHLALMTIGHLVVLLDCQGSKH